MALAADIGMLRDRVLAALNAAHDYYADTKLAWDIVDQFIAGGNSFISRNTATGTDTTQADLAGKARGYLAEQLPEATFQQFISIFEDFFFEFLRLWLVAFPASLGVKQVEFKDILEAPDKDAITLLVVNRELNGIQYKRPAEWFGFLDSRVKLGCPAPEEIDRIAEAKASRDVLAHNRGIANKTYESKAGAAARHKEGERIEISEHYHRETWDLIRKVVADIADAAIAKAP